ncbi:MAG: 16S rRNA (guanine(527)-N(7))-methyltransferase RsmG [Prevotella sp.]|nr:16S rRNA (guanine(527)-N(7))-methyltransferase RsmG [Prevotella sp.]
MIEIITKNFPELSEKQKQQFEMLDALYRDWNAKINVISRKDIDNIYVHHVLHSLAIAKAIRFKDGSRILDFGTGGGFPGIPLAIMFPNCKFRLIDGTGKKIMVANEVAKSLGLENVEAVHRRGEEEKGEYDFIVSRAVMQLPLLVKIIQKNISKKEQNALPNGLLCLKGGDLKEELKPYQNIVDVMPLEDMFDEEWFKEDKKLIYLPMA